MQCEAVWEGGAWHAGGRGGALDEAKCELKQNVANVRGGGAIRCLGGDGGEGQSDDVAMCVEVTPSDEERNTRN